MRIGLHTNDSPGHDKALAYCERVKPAVMKWLSPDAAILRECRRVSPATKHIGRIVWGDQDHTHRPAFNARTLDAAREFNGLVDYWEGYNEHIGDQAEPRVIRAFADDEVDFAKKLNAIGVGALIGGFSTGTLDDGKLEAFASAFNYMTSVGPRLCALHFHEYAAAYMAYNVKTADGMNQWPDGGSFTGISTGGQRVWYDKTLRGWLTLRYRDLLPLLAARGWGSVRAYITESGIDNTNKDPRTNAKGWKDSRGTQFERIDGLGDYAGQLHWWAWQLSHDPFILGAVDFGFGATDPAWASFDLATEPAMLEAVMSLQTALPIGHWTPDGLPAPTPAPPLPPPAPPPPTSTIAGVSPRIQVLRGDGWTSLARRALWREPKVKEVTALCAANGGGAVPAAGSWIISPFHKVTLA